ncbi:hypothetical protein H4582DRAFT_1162321 [Lactarius indigo]|nr:hypothetical protein H4582DRAFT_1162321 [Lactarius indigo]
MSNTPVVFSAILTGMFPMTLFPTARSFVLRASCRYSGSPQKRSQRICRALRIDTSSISMPSVPGPSSTRCSGASGGSSGTSNEMTVSGSQLQAESVLRPRQQPPLLVWRFRRA